MKASKENTLKEVQVRLCLKNGNSLLSNEAITSPNIAVKVMGKMMCQMDREMLCVVNLDIQNRPINYNVVSIGGINQSTFVIGNIFKSAILCNAAKIIAMHNHPSGSMIASREDKLATFRLVQAGKLFDIEVLDHVIVGNTPNKFCSIRRNHDELFNTMDDVGKLSLIQKISSSDQRSAGDKNEEVNKSKCICL